MQFPETEVHIYYEAYLWPLKTYSENNILIVAICIEKSIFPESKEGTLYKQDRHICKVCLPYKEIFNRRFGLKTRALPAPLIGGEEPFLKFGRVHHEKQL